MFLLLPPPLLDFSVSYTVCSELPTVTVVTGLTFLKHFEKKRIRSHISSMFLYNTFTNSGCLSFISWNTSYTTLSAMFWILSVKYGTTRS
jgi:hypothetical protein